jgi:hypothetical protein
VQAVDALIQAGANCNPQNSLTGATPLHMVAQSRKATIDRRLQVVQLLVLAGGDTALADNYGKVPVECLLSPIAAAAAGEVEDRQFQELKDKLQPAAPGLFQAIQDHSVERVRALLSPSSSIQVHFRAMTPLSLAVREIIELMSSPSSDNDDVNTQTAALQDIVNVLLQAGASTEAPAPDEPTPLLQLWTEIQKHTSTTTESSSASTSSDWKVQFLENIMLAVVKHCSIPPDGWQVLHNAARRGQVSHLRFLVERLGLDPNCIGRQGMRALQFAARSGQVNALVRVCMCGSGCVLLDKSFVHNQPYLACDMFRFGSQNAAILAGSTHY